MAKISKITPVTTDDRLRLRYASAHGLPDHPTARGMKPIDIKRALADPVVGEGDSVMAMLIRLTTELSNYDVALSALLDALQVDVDGANDNIEKMWGDGGATGSIRGIASEVAGSLLSAHNASGSAHMELRSLIVDANVRIGNLTARLNAIADSDDETLDQMSEQVAYIKANRDLIELVTTAKVSVADIVDSLYSSEANKPLSAARGAELRRLIEAVNNTKLDATRLTDAINTALHSAKESGEFGSDPAWTIRAAGEVVVPTSAWTEQNYAFVTLPGEEANKIEEGDLVLLFPSDSTTRTACGVYHVHVESADASDDSVFLFQCDFIKDQSVFCPLTFNYRVLSCAKPLMRTTVEIVGVNYQEVYRTHLDALEEQIAGLSKLLAGDGDGGMSVREIAEEVVEDHDSSELAHADIRELIETLAANVYDKEAVDRLVSLIPKLTIEPVEALPELENASLTAFYLVPSGEGESDVYTEWFCVEKDGVRAWERLGTQKMDLSGYATTEAMNMAIANAIADALVGYVTGVEVDGKISKALSDYVDTSALQTALTEALKSYAKTTAIPTKLSQLEADAAHRTVTDAEKAAWNAKAPGNHTHDGLYQPKGNYQPAGNYAAEGHTHDDLYVKKEELAGSWSIPSYWEGHLSEKEATIKALQDEGGKDAFSFVVMTDIHYPANLGKKSPVIAKRILDECDIRFALCLGDTQTRGCHGTKEKVLTENANIEAMLSPIRGRLLQTQGNHDGNYGVLDDVNYVYSLTKGEMHSAVYRKVGLVGDCHFDESGTGYYIDDTANKVRYIVLNTHNTSYELNEDGTQKYPPMTTWRFTQSQFDLLIDAFETIPADSWGVVASAHVPLTRTEIGDRSIMLGVLNAFKNKTAYSGEYVGTATASAAYTNLLPLSTDGSGNIYNGTGFKNKSRFNSSGVVKDVTDGSEVFTTGYIPVKAGEIVRLNGNYIKTDDSGAAGYNNYVYDESYTKLGGFAMNSTSYYTNVKTNGDGYIAEFSIDPSGSLANCAYIRLSLLGVGDGCIITANEEIVENAHGYDYVSVDADFSTAKGELIGYFAGHSHTDSLSVVNDVPVITTRCDGAEENDSTLKAERVTGTITEQSFDVFTVNKKTRTIHATKIGAGADRVISY